MCGIFLLLKKYVENFSTAVAEYELFEKSICRRGPDLTNVVNITKKDHTFLFAASVLWLQGETLVNQPVINEYSVFVYNGDVFGGCISEELRKIHGDTPLFLNLLEDSGLINLHNIEGPYSFIYLDKRTFTLCFGRDQFGRRSLLLGKNGGNIILTSVARRCSGYEFMELPSIGTFSYDLNKDELHLIPWQSVSENFVAKLNELETFLQKGIHLIEASGKPNIHMHRADSVNSLFLNVILQSSHNYFDILLNDSLWFKNVIELKTLLERSIEKRLSAQPVFCKRCIGNLAECHHATTGVLFSGGVDCAVLALLASKFVVRERPIDLLNVAFSTEKNYKTPDRITGLDTLQELKNIDPNRQWNFLEINITEVELNNKRKTEIADLIYPLNTILDDSLGCALWFASRGQTESYSSTCRVLLVGMGADELFGGYTRHRTAFNRRGWDGLQMVLTEDWQNLPHRNLGRDDRVVSDHGRQLRTPFLDESVVKFVQKLPPWNKTWPSKELPQGIGEKILLRCLAYHLGLKNAATFKKRALQFGSRIANSKEQAHLVSPRLI